MDAQATVLPGKNPDALARGSAVLREGGLVGMPTETVYGLACDALNPRAVAGVFAAKERPSFDPLIVHVRDIDHAQTLAVFDGTAATLAQRFWPGPLTLVLPKRLDPKTGEPIVPGIVTAGLDRVGLRVPAHPVAQSLLHDSGLALAAPSANRFGSISPTTARHVADELAGRVDLILDGGPCKQGVESTVVSVRSGGVSILRLGATSVEQVEQALPGVAVELARPTSDPGNATTPASHNAGQKTENIAASDPAALPSPGMTNRHYAPRTPLRLVEGRTDGEGGERLFHPANPRPTNPRAETTPDPFSIAPGGRVGLIALGDVSRWAKTFAQTRSLSESGDLTEAAANLFAVMRELDGLGLDGIVAVGVPDEGIGRAINDRLRRASVR